MPGTTADLDGLTREQLAELARATPDASTQLLLLDHEPARHPNVRRALASNAALAPDAQRALADSPFAPVRAALALNPSLEPGLQRELSRDARPWVRGNLAQNPSVPPGILVELSFVEDPHVSLVLGTVLHAEIESWTSSGLLERLAVPFLRDTELGQQLLSERLDALTGVDALTRTTLVQEWEGDLRSLLSACSSLSA